MEDHMKIICIFLIIPVLTIGRAAALIYPDFEATLKKECFEDKKFEDWKPESALTVENFIYVVEKIETTYHSSAADLIETLLASFSCSRLGFKEESLKRDSTARVAEQLMKKFVGENKHKALELTHEEKCQLFFFLSPAVKTVTDRSDNSETSYGFGVLSVNGNIRQSIDISKVLHGIFAGLKNDPKKSIKDLVYPIDDKQPEYATEEVSMLYASTISEVINAAGVSEKSFIDDNYANEGVWDSRFCAKEYVFHKEQNKWPISAEILGAVDGFLLGHKIKDMQERENMKLSQILRMYYSWDGFLDETEDKRLSYCDRHLNIQDSDLIVETTKYLKAYHLRGGEPPSAKAVEVVEKYVPQFLSLYTTVVTQQADEGDDCLKNREKGVDICETPSNVFAVLDRRTDNITVQEEATRKLIGALNIGLDEDTITIYTNEDNENLKTIVNASDSKAEALCALEGYNQYVSRYSDDSEVLTDIRNVMTVYEENQKSLHAVPAKVVVYFNFGKMGDDKRTLDKARRELKSRHPYLMMIPIGSDADYLKEYFTNNQPSRMIPWNKQNLAQNLKKSICLAPAVLQHPNCETKSRFGDNEYTGYIGQQRIHHWAMYPQYFLKTFDYKFQFTVKFGKIRVCYSRKEPIQDSGEGADGGKKNCLETSEIGNPIVFSDKDPCKDRTVHNCNPIYFTIFGRDDPDKSTCSREIDNIEVGCKRLDLIEYTIKHEGISCNSGRKIISSPFLQILLAFLVMCYIISQQK